MKAGPSGRRDCRSWGYKPRAFELALAIIALASVFALALARIIDYDVWFHLKTGELIVNTRAIPATDVFSHTAYGREWITHEWLFEVLIYLVYLASGVDGLTVMKAIFVTATFGAYIWGLKRFGAGPLITAPVVAIAAVVARDRYLERPELATYLFTAIFILVFERLRERPEEAGIKTAGLLAFIMALWANLHSGAIFGLFISCAYAFGEAADGFLKKEPERFKTASRLSIISLVIAASGLLNPNTLSVYTYPFLALRINESENLNIAEFKPPTWEESAHFFIALSVAAVIIAFNLRRTPLARVLLFLAFSISALRFTRNVAEWVVISAPFVAFSIRDLASSLPDFRSLGFKARGATAFIIIALTAVPSWATVAKMSSFGDLGLGVKPGWFPEGAAAFLERNNLKGKMYNSYEFGGYFIWMLPDRPVFVDGRADVYRGIFTEYLTFGTQGFDSIVERYGLDYAVMSYKNPEITNTEPYLGGGMALVYWDDVAMIFLKRTTENAPIIERYEYRSFKPTDVRFEHTSAPLPAIIAELERSVAENPYGWRNHALLGGAYWLAGDYARAEAERNIYERTLIKR